MRRLAMIGGILAIVAVVVVVIILFSTGRGDNGPAAAPDPPDASPTAATAPLTVEVPIEVRGAVNVGGLQLELIYDPEVLNLQEVRTGTLGRNALLESNNETPGRLKLALVDASGINGDGAVITVIFLPTARGGGGSLTLESVEASDTDLRDLVVQSISTRFTGVGALLDPLVLDFAR